MTSIWRAIPMIPVIILLGCEGNLLQSEGRIEPFTTIEPCTDPIACCPKEQIRCTGDPDRGGIICKCVGLWDCTGSSAKECGQDKPVPPGAGSWSCTWSEFSYTCSAAGDQQNPPGGGGWDCVWSNELSEWNCVREDVPNPTNSPEGAGSWTCAVDNELDQLACVKSNPEVTPPVTTEEQPQPEENHPEENTPPGNDESQPAPEQPTLPQGAECIPGQKKWCDGEQYCGWGQVTCRPDGTWEEICMELSDGSRPNTTCGCYNFYFEEECCETPDCILPAGTDGQICGKSGGQLCDYCNPENPECAEAGAECIIAFGSAFCGRACSAAAPCPSGFHCIPYISGSNFGSQCMPFVNTCY